MSSEKWFENNNGLPVTEIVKLESEYRIDSLVCAIEELLLAKEDEDIEIKDEELVVLAVEAMEREVNNGGFAQFFSNDSWRFSPYLVDCLNEIGSIQAKEITEKAISVLGLTPLTETTDVEKYYENIQKTLEDDDVTEKLEGVDSQYFEMDENIAGLVFDFVKNNLASFTEA